MRNLTSHAKTRQHGVLKDRRAKNYARRPTRPLRADSAPRSRPFDATPVVEARRITIHPDNDLLELTCPFCLTVHRHGACGKGSPLGAGDGLALAHCSLGSYDIREVA